MIEVKILDKDIVEYLTIVSDLKKRGYVIGKDFDFTYHPPRFDNFSNEAVYNRCVIFTFYKEEMASWFTLLYQ